MYTILRAIILLDKNVALAYLQMLLRASPAQQSPAQVGAARRSDRAAQDTTVTTFTRFRRPSDHVYQPRRAPGDLFTLLHRTG